jgi:GTP cyclohydrolase I
VSDAPVLRETNGAVTTGVDIERVERAMREILLAIGEDPDRDGLLRTPHRVAEMYAEIFSGLHEDPSRHLVVTFEANHDEMVLVRDIALYSMCEHHLAPFHGRAHVAYIPGDDGRITGLSKLARLVDGFAKRPQVQERLTTQIADARGPQTGHPHPDLGCARAVQGQCRDPGGGHVAHRSVRRPLLNGWLTSGRGRHTPPPRR